MSDDLKDALLPILLMRGGHFVFESGHHGDVWLDLDALFLHPARLEPFVTALAEQLRPHRVQGVCGPLSGGAFLAQMLAHRLAVDFYYSERLPTREYQIPPALRTAVNGKRIAMVDDAINAGWAIRSTFADLLRHGGVPVVAAALLTSNDAAATSSELKIPLLSIASLPGHLWTPKQCPLCVAGIPLTD